MRDTILIIDDYESSREVLQTIVEMMGYKTALCDDGAEGIRFMVEHHKSILMIFLDIYMPQVDGISTLGHLRNHYPDVPVAVITGTDDTDDETVVRNLGAASFISKPFPGELIRETVRALVNVPPSRSEKTAV